MLNKLIIDWKEYNLIVEKLAVKIYETGFRPTMLIGIMRGGAPIIDVLSGNLIYEIADNKKVLCICDSVTNFF